MSSSSGSLVSVGGGVLRREVAKMDHKQGPETARAESTVESAPHRQKTNVV